MAANVYSIIEEKGFDNGIAFIATQDDSIIEARLYGGIVISFKCLRLSPEQILGVLASGTIKDITLQKSDIQPRDAQPEVVAQTFPAAVAASALTPARTAHSRMLRIVQMMSALTGMDKDQGAKAFDIVSRQIAALYPGFKLDPETIGKRIEEVGEKFGIATGFLAGKPMPGDIYSAPQWVFSQFEAVVAGAMKEVILFFIFFGAVSGKVLSTTVEKETSLGAKKGFAILSSAVYPELKGSSSAFVYKGAEKIGELKIDWQTNKKTAVALTKADLDRFGLENGTKVNLVFET